MVEPRLKADSRLLPEGLSFAWQAADACAPFAEGHALRAHRAATLAGEQAHQRAEAINRATPYPPRMTAAKLPATTARRKAVVMAYSMGNP
jgi:hypothetical protein